MVRLVSHASLLRLIILCRTRHPAQDNVRLNVQNRSQCVPGTPRPEELSANFLKLLTAYIQSGPLPSPRSFSLEWIVALITERPDRERPSSLDSHLSFFFWGLAQHDPCWEIRNSPVHVSQLPDMLERSLAAQCLVHYLVQVSSRDRQQYITTIADHIISVIRALANGTESQMAHVDLYRQALAPLDRLPSHPAWPFLSFVILLTWKSSDAAGIFLDHGFIRDVHKLAGKVHALCHRCMTLLAWRIGARQSSEAAD